MFQVQEQVKDTPEHGFWHCKGNWPKASDEVDGDSAWQFVNEWKNNTRWPVDRKAWPESEVGKRQMQSSACFGMLWYRGMLPHASLPTLLPVTEDEKVILQTVQPNHLL